MNKSNDNYFVEIKKTSWTLDKDKKAILKAHAKNRGNV